VLGKLLAERVFGARPVTLCGYSLGALVIFEALKHLATLAPAKSVHLVQDVFLFGLPAPAAPRTWTAVRRVVAGRLVNGYSESDYVLAVLARSSDASWAVAGLGPVGVRGVENVDCSDVDGHIAWRGHIGSSLRAAHAEGLNDAEVDKQIQNVARKIDEAIAESEKQAKEDKDMQKELDGQRSMDSDK
jgi:pimeloyl-ACP methyl ester carboxylesterase